ncbi:flagellar biosynthesis protein FlgN [Tersicoccus phoenicis]|uniref:Flagellar biosynthesis protein FlgN n=1 Tax=Tersicoccus phoenicis TaxID=554083 RepID=A0A1R1L7M6_9MICC|nr:flagellar protein FlgN [Tersicoccus phoenicis]OMH23532.1 flagellar biosynthesis protein FlgN [Tersicoccus phoenicis]
MSFTDLSAQLWRERELLDTLTFRLEVEQLLLTAGRTRRLPQATAEVEQVVDQLAVAGLERTVMVAALATEWGAPTEATLRELAEVTPDGAWQDILRSHLAAMVEQTATIRSLRDANEQFLRAAARATEETMATMAPSSRTYDATGSAAPSSLSRFLDQNL